MRKLAKGFEICDIFFAISSVCCFVLHCFVVLLTTDNPKKVLQFWEIVWNHFFESHYLENLEYWLGIWRNSWYNCNCVECNVATFLSELSNVINSDLKTYFQLISRDMFLRIWKTKCYCFFLKMIQMQKTVVWKTFWSWSQEG